MTYAYSKQSRQWVNVGQMGHVGARHIITASQNTEISMFTEIVRQRHTPIVISPFSYTAFLLLTL